MLAGFGKGALFAQVTAGFTANVTSGCGSLLVFFSNTSTGPINSYSWDFGNGNTSTLASTGTVYSTPGTYTVTLTVTGAGGSNTLTRTGYITVHVRPTAFLAANPTIGCSPLTVQFTNSSLPGSGVLASQSWDFGDGNSSTQASPTHTFAPGNYNVRVTATNSNGCSATSAPTLIQALPPITAGFTADTTQSCSFPFTVQFTDTSVGVGPFTYNWDFGDGNTSTAANPQHTYATPGNYTVRLIVNRAACSDTLVQANFIQYLPLEAGFTTIDSQVCRNVAVAFLDTTLGNVVAWDWDFGDGGTATSQNPSHAYAASGFYTVRLIVTNAIGCSDTITKVNWIEVLSSPTPAFSAPVVTGCGSPLGVNFTNGSVGGSTYLWSFGDGATSTQVAPSHTYILPGNVPGTFDVKLVVTDAAGCSDSLTQTSMVHISPPVAGFTFSVVQSGCSPRLVQFTDTSTSAYDPIIAWDWDFGDLPNSNNPNPPHLYNTPGVWTVSLIVTTVTGCKDTLTLPNFLSTGNTPNASYTISNLNPCFGDPVTFTSTSTGSPNAYFWDFGNGFVQDSATVTYVFPDTGCYVVSFIASQNGCNDSTAATSTVCVRGVRPQFAMSATSACTAPATVNFTDQSVSANPIVYDWDFGDGSPHATTANPSHTYNMPGTYIITLTATDVLAGCSDAFTRTFTIASPIAAFSSNMPVGCASLPITFTNASTGATSYQWSFGTGATSPQANPTYTYLVGGTYSVTLIATDAVGCADTMTQSNSILIHDLTPNFSAMPTTACLGDTVFFADLSTSDGVVNGWNWNFGNGTTSTLQNPAQVYTATGTYAVKLVAQDNNGCIDSLTRLAYVRIRRPNASFTISNQNVCPGQTVFFNSTSTGFGPLSYIWDFGDGSGASTSATNHVYAAAGSYIVRLEVTDGSGCKATFIRTVTVARPVASFAVSDSISNCPPLLVQFTNTSTGNVSGWMWSFGDGSGSTNQNPSHVYDSVGSFAVQLIVFTPTGCRDTLTMPNRVVVLGPMLSFQATNSTACTSDSVEYILTSNGAFTPIWDFGDGSLQVGGDTVQHLYTVPSSYAPTVIAYDTNGCSSTAPPIPPITILPAPVAALGVLQTGICRNDTADFVDLSTYGAALANLSWDFGDGQTGIGAPISHYYGQSGIFTVAITVTDTLGCLDSDTVVAAVLVHSYDAGFINVPTVTCPGNAIQFTDTSQHDSQLVGWAWDFGDSTQDSGAVVQHSYGDTGYYDVQLIITTAQGCQDTLLVPNAVQVQIPVGSFTYSIDTTCPGMPITFVSIADSGVFPTWLWGNGTQQVGGDSVTFGYPNPGIYYPGAIFTDSLGCSSVLIDTLGITVFPGPTAIAQVDTALHCEPDSVDLLDLSSYPGGVGSLSWDFGDGQAGTAAAVTHFYAAPGVYDVVLSVTDALGCSDTDTVLAAVVIHTQTALFGADSTTGCLPATIQFHDSSSADDVIAAWAWDFGDGGTAATANPSHIYSDTGSFNVTLIITTASGCRDTLVLTSLIDFDPPQVPALWAVSVEGDNAASALLQADSSALFDSYELYRLSSPGSPIASTYLQTDTLLLDLASNSLSSPACYAPVLANICRDSSALALARVHCTMELQAIPGLEVNTLTWTPYVGWDSILRYEIYQVVDYDTATSSILASVSPAVSVYVDSLLSCDELRTYRVRAVGLAQQERSWSDTSAARPIHSAPSYVPQMITASVLNNADIEVSWVASPLPGSSTAELFRSTDGSIWTSIGNLAAPAVNYLDATANVGAQSYYYRVELADSCGYKTQPSGHARSILLALDGSDGTAQLSWNGYGDWTGGVARYELEVRPMQGTNWLPMSSLNASTLLYHDEVGLAGEDQICYRVTAYETAGNQALSRSNEVCFSQELWVPNTITPNGDGYNDVLTVRGITAYPGTGITIYNRWGNVVYEVDDYRNEWAGTSGNRGEALPDGTYFWVLDVSDGRQLRGFVTILR